MIELDGIKRLKKKNPNTTEYWNNLWDNHGGGERNEPERFLPMVAFAVKDKPAIDIGCAMGHLCHYLYKHGCRPVYGIDFSSEAIDKAHRNYGDECVFLTSPAEHIPFPAAIFDTVTIAQTLEHLDDPLIALNEAARICTTDGVIIFSVPRESDYTEHVWWFTVEGTKRLIKYLGVDSLLVTTFDNGKRILGCFSFGHEIDLQNRQGKIAVV